jgi:hypothetical protein
MDAALVTGISGFGVGVLGILLSAWTQREERAGREKALALDRFEKISNSLEEAVSEGKPPRELQGLPDEADATFEALARRVRADLGVQVAETPGR